MVCLSGPEIKAKREFLNNSEDILLTTIRGQALSDET